MTNKKQNIDRAKKRPIEDILPYVRMIHQYLDPKASELLKTTKEYPEIAALFADGFSTVRKHIDRMHRWLDALNRDAIKQSLIIDAKKERGKIPDSPTRN